MEKNHVSDVITWDDISSHKITAIYSGVGSGKNKFVEKITTDCVIGQTEPKNVLLITSRKAKVNETILQLEDAFSTYIGIEGNVRLEKGDWIEYIYGEGSLPANVMRYEVDKENKILNKSVICTYAKIEALLKRIYEYDLELLYGYNSILWEWFDVIVIDEVHSLLMDSSYQSAPFHIYNLIKTFNEKCDKKDKHMILMTGTPQPVDKILHSICDDLHVINLFDTCINTLPKEIHFIDSGSLKKDIQNKLLSGSKIIYFYNGIAVTSREFCYDTDINENIVATTFTDSEKREQYKNHDDSGYARMVYTENLLTGKNKLPEDIQLLLTTSRLKEGINIEDDIDYVYIDSHLPADVIQMSGRIRNGNHIVYIVVNSFQFDDERDIQYEKDCISNDKEDIDDCNENLRLLTETKDRLSYIEEITDEYIIQDGEKKINSQYKPYIQFNYFDGKFEFYKLKEWYLKYKLSNINKWNSLNPNKPGSYKTLVKKWFPDDVLIATYESKSYKSVRLFKDKYKFKIDSQDAQDTYKKSRIEQFLSDLNKIWGTDYKRVGSHLKKFMPGVELKNCGKSKDKYKFVTKKKH